MALSTRSQASQQLNKSPREKQPCTKILKAMNSQIFTDSQVDTECELALLRAITVAQAILYFSSPMSSWKDEPQPPHKPGPGAVNLAIDRFPQICETNLNCFHEGGKRAA